MSKSGKKAEKREEKIKAEAERAHKSRLKLIYIVVSIIIIISIFVGIAFETPPAYVQCFPTSTAWKEQYSAKIFIYVGSTNYQFIRIPDADLNHTTMGFHASCTYPIAITGRGDYGSNWTRLHIQSPYVHDYTLGDFFRVWSEGRQVPVHFGPDGVASVSGRTVVQYNWGAESPASPDMAIHPGDFIIIRVYQY